MPWRVNQAMIFSTSAPTSTPMPSPGNSRRLKEGMRVSVSVARGSEPGTRSRSLLLKGIDGGLLLHGQADCVEAVAQEVLAERIDLESYAAAVRPANFLGIKIDRDGA